MNYIRIHIHSFQCDMPGCLETEDVGEHYKRDAVKLAEKEGWQIGPYFIRCPKHKGQPIPARKPA